MRASWICDRLIRAAAAAGIRGHQERTEDPESGRARVQHCRCCAQIPALFLPRGIWLSESPRKVGDGVGEEEMEPAV